MLSDDQNDQSERTESGSPAPEAQNPPGEAAATSTPVVTRRTRKSPARKSAAAPPAADAPADAVPGAAPDADPAAGDPETPVVRKTTTRRAPAKKAPARKTAAKKTAPAAEPDDAPESEVQAVEETQAPALSLIHI